MREEKENYIPSHKEVAEAEKMMTPEQRAASETREHFMFQENDPFEDFMEHIDQNDERRPPTPEEKKRMDVNLIKLGTVFASSDVRWHLDGALNISLMKGEYIGIHKDVDISVEQDDVEKLDEQLGRTAYGLFLHYPVDSQNPEGKKILERVGAKKFSKAPAAHLTIAAIDEHGKIRKGEDLNFIDVHVIRRNERGKYVGRYGVELPDKWSEKQVISFQGQEIRLCHPAEIAYFKLHDIRTYDRTDLRALAGTRKLTLEDLSDIELAFEQETIARKREAEILLSRVTEKISPEMSADQIFNTFIEEPRVAQVIEQIRESLKILSQEIEASDKSRDEIIRLALETFNFKALVEEQHKKIEELKRWVADAIL